MYFSFYFLRYLFRMPPVWLPSYLGMFLGKTPGHVSWKAWKRLGTPRDDRCLKDVLFNAAEKKKSSFDNKPAMSRVATQDLFRARDANTSMIKILQTSQVKMKILRSNSWLWTYSRNTNRTSCHVVKTSATSADNREKKGAKERKWVLYKNPFIITIIWVPLKVNVPINDNASHIRGFLLHF